VEVIAIPLGVCTAKNVALGYDVGKISAGCVVMFVTQPILHVCVFVMSTADVFTICRQFFLRAQTAGWEWQSQTAI